MVRSDDEDLPATQPILSLLLQGVVAYVEVRSGHDNRSRGIKTQLRNLGATISESLTRDVTHVIFNEGLPSTYQKAKKLNCHLVSVLWIAACKEQLSKVSEAGFPPIGQKIYENPNSLKNFKKLKSMQPDFDDEVDALKTNKIIKQIQRRGRKRTKTTDVIHENADNELSNSKQEQTHYNKKETKGRSKRTCRSSKKTTALSEITPDVVNKDKNLELHSIHLGTSTITVETQATSSAQESTSSSSSVICLGKVEGEAGPSKINTKRKSKMFNETSVTRADFVRGLSDIVLSLSEERKEKAHQMSFWRKQTTAPASKVAKKRLSSVVSSPRRSPRHAAKSMQLEIPVLHKEMKSQKPVPCVSASAFLYRRLKMPPPSSPEENFVLLSQEPGDMPTVDELAKMKRGAINVGNEQITLSQVIRAYDTVAQGNCQQSSQSSGSLYFTCQSQSKDVIGEEEKNSSACVSQGKYCGRHDSMMFSEDAGTARQSENKSEGRSSTSSFSTTVLINGKSSPKSNCIVPTSSTLPSSEGTDCENMYVQDPASEEEMERSPSPIFIIKKPKSRKLVKNYSGGSKTSSFERSVVSDKELTPDSSRVNKSIESKQTKKHSLNPIDYLNRLLLPKFSNASQTPETGQVENALVEETPIVSCLERTEKDSTVIPPTPTEDGLQALTVKSGVSPSESLTSSVMSWMKKSCKIPLFASRSFRVSSSSAEDSTPKVQASASSEKDSLRQNLYETPKQTNNATESRSVKSEEIKSFQKSFKAPASSCSESERQLRTSNRISKRKLSDCKNEKCALEVHALSVEPKDKRKQRGRVVVKVIPNDDVERSASCQENVKNDFKLLVPKVEIQQVEDEVSSSGYDTTQCDPSSGDKETQYASATKATVKKKGTKATLSPPKDVPKNNYSSYQSLSISNKQCNIEQSTRKSERKRLQTSPNHHSKKPRVTKSEDSQSFSGSKISLLSTVCSIRGTKSLSFEDSKPLERKSTGEAKKRIVKSATKIYSNDKAKVIVCTFLTASEQNGIDIAGQSLGCWKLEDNVTAKTTHVINSGPKRTLNMLKGMSRGCWLVNQNWMLDSAKVGTWLAEEKYELVEFSPAVKICREKRQLLGNEFMHSLFLKAGTIFVSPKTKSPPAKDVKELLELCGADLRTTPADCKIIVGENLKQKGNCKCVSALWVLDCVTRNKILPVNGYKIK